MRRGIRILCGCLAIVFLAGALIALVFEKNWKVLISGGSFSILFGYLAMTGRTPSFLR